MVWGRIDPSRANKQRPKGEGRESSYCRREGHPPPPRNAHPSPGNQWADKKWSDLPWLAASLHWPWLFSGLAPSAMLPSPTIGRSDMDDLLSVQVHHAKPLEFPADALAVQYPQRLHGVVERVVETLVGGKRHVLLPQPGVVRLLDSVPGISARRVLIVGVAGLAIYDYRDLRKFSQQAISYLASVPGIHHVAMPAYGSRGYQIDDDKGFEAQISGIVDAIRGTTVSDAVTTITLVERDAERAARLDDRLSTVLKQSFHAAATSGSDLSSRTMAAIPPTEGFPIAQPRTLFVCYRREDSQDAAGRLHDRLAHAYGSERVFMDIDNVPLGVNFVSFISAQLQHCSAVLVMIGRNWTTATDQRGRRRLDDPADHVRVEIAAALKQQVPVIPILVQDASMPNADELPEDMRSLAFYNALKLTPEFWRAGVERLIKELDRVLKPSGDR